MLDTRVLLNKITAFRERLEQMPRLVPESLPKAEPAPKTPVDSQADLLARVQAGCAPRPFWSNRSASSPSFRNLLQVPRFR